MQNATTSTVLSGSWPVRAHTDRFFGTVKADGQHPRVAALVCYRGDVVALSLVGYDTSVSAVLANLWLREAVPFEVAEDVTWKGPLRLQRRPEGYKQFSTRLAGTKEVHAIALPLSAHIAEGILHPPDLPAPPKEEQKDSHASGKAAPIEAVPIDRTRFVLGNWDEPAPHLRSFLGQLYAMRVLFLHRDHNHPEWALIWAEELWRRGLARKLVVPLKEALGMKAWMLSGDLVTWGQLVGDGVRAGWLPWQDTLTESVPMEAQRQEELVLVP